MTPPRPVAPGHPPPTRDVPVVWSCLVVVAAAAGVCALSVLTGPLALVGAVPACGLVLALVHHTSLSSPPEDLPRSLGRGFAWSFAGAGVLGLLTLPDGVVGPLVLLALAACSPPATDGLGTLGRRAGDLVRRSRPPHPDAPPAPPA